MPPNQIKVICQRLSESFGPFRFRSQDPLDSLIATVLSQNTTDTNSGRAFARLKKAFPTWEAALHAPRSQIERAIASGGLAHTKSRYIKVILTALAADTGTPSLKSLSRMPTDQARTFLLQLPGVGLKTASCVLLFSLRRPVCPVDTHVLRVAKRLHLVSEKSTADQTAHTLEALLPDDCMLTFHLGLVRLGRTVCRPRNPRHTECILQSLCPSARLKT